MAGPFVISVLTGVTRRPGPGLDSPTGAGEAAAAADAARKAEPGTAAAKKNRLFYTLFKNCKKFGVFNQYYANQKQERRPEAL